VLGLLDGNLEALGLTIACQRGGGMADGTVRVHPDDRLAGLVVSGIHLSGWNGTDGETRGRIDSNEAREESGSKGKTNIQEDQDGSSTTMDMSPLR
jgi:hypothetical protein